MAAAVDIGTLVVRTPEMQGGRPRIAGTGVTVRRIAGWYQLGLSPEEIAPRVGHVSLAQVDAALAYYHANRGEIDADIAGEEDEAERLEQDHYLSRKGARRYACMLAKMRWRLTDVEKFVDVRIK